MPTRDVNVGAGDGYVRKYGGAWSGLITTGAVTGNDAYPTATADYCCVCENTNPMNGRGFFPFDLSSSLPAGATITALDLKIYVTAKGSAGGGTSANNSVCVVKGTPASTTTLATTDFGNVGSTEWASRTQFSAFTTNAYNTISLNSTAIADAQARYNAGERFVPALRGGYDIDNVSPGGNSNIQTKFQENGSNAAVLTVTFTLDRTTSDAWAWSDAADITAKSGGTIRTYSRSTSDAWAWSDREGRTSPPPARTVGTPYTIWAGGSSGSFGDHCAFANIVRLSDGRLRAFCRKASQHGATLYDGDLVTKTSSDDGVTWSSETTILDHTVTGYDHRDTFTTVLTGYGSNPAGRLCMTWGRRKLVGGASNSDAVQFMYSDDGGSTWSTPVSVASGLYTGASGVYGEVFGDSIIERHNGDLLLFGYGSPSAGSNAFDLFCSKSTDGGATWSTFGTMPADHSTYGYGLAEPQVIQFDNGKLLMTFRTLDPVPTDFYTSYSTDGGSTWSTPVKQRTDTSNRQGLNVLGDGRSAFLTFLTYPSQAYYYIESLDYGVTWSTARLVATPSTGYGLWCMAAPLHGSLDQQNVGVVYDTEQGTQNGSSVKFVQLSGTDGIFVHLRTTSDSWAWSDSNTRTIVRTRTTTDGWAWSDAATRQPFSYSKATSDAWAWTDTNTRVVTTIQPRTTSDTWAWTDTALANSGGTFARSASDTWTWTDSVSHSVSSGPAPRTTADAWAWTDVLTRTSTQSRSAADFWLWAEPATTSAAPRFWLLARRRTMSAPSKTYVQVLPKGTTRTTSYTSPTYEAKTEAGILVVLDVTSASGTGGLTLRINAHDQASSQAIPLNAAPTAVTTAGTTSYSLYPFSAVAGNVTQATSFYLPRLFSITVTAGDTSSYTYSIGYCLLP